MRYGKPRLQGQVGSIACLHSSYSCGVVCHAFRVSSLTPGRFKPVILTSLHDMEGSRSFMQGGSSQGVSGRRGDSAASQCRRREGGASEARARQRADRGWKTLPVHRMPHPHPLRLGSTHECPHCHAVLLNIAESQGHGVAGDEQLVPGYGWSHICHLAFRKYCCSRPNVHTKVAEASDATCMVHDLRRKEAEQCLIRR